MEPFPHHVFVCTQEKPEGVTSCSANGSARVLEAFERQIASQGLDNQIQVTTCGRLGLCEEGPVVITYPEGTWYRNVKAEDAAEMMNCHFRSGKVVSRLVWNDAEAMKAQIIEHREHYSAAMNARDRAGDSA